MTTKDAASEYFEKKQIPRIFEELCSMLAFHQPVDPKKFLVDELTKRKNKTNARFFTESELAGYFGTIQEGKKEISKETFLQAAACLQSNSDEINVGDEKINKEKFVSVLKDKTF